MHYPAKPAYDKLSDLWYSAEFFDWLYILVILILMKTSSSNVTGMTFTSYCGAKKELIPGDTPVAPLLEMWCLSTHCFVDANHVGNLVTCCLRLVTYFLLTECLSFGTASVQTQLKPLYLAVNLSPWNSSLNLYADTNCICLAFLLRTTLLPNVYYDNETVTKKAIYPESRLKKKHNSMLTIIPTRQ